MLLRTKKIPKQNLKKKPTQGYTTQHLGLLTTGWIGYLIDQQNKLFYLSIFKFFLLSHMCVHASCLSKSHNALSKGGNSLSIPQGKCLWYFFVKSDSLQLHWSYIFMLWGAGKRHYIYVRFLFSSRCVMVASILIFVFTLLNIDSSDEFYVTFFLAEFVIGFIMVAWTKYFYN